MDVKLARPARSPRPIIAGLLTLFVAGLGQLYAGDPGRAIAIFVAVDTAFAVLLAFVARWPRLAMLALGAALGLALTAFIVRDAVRVARRASASRRSWFSR